MNLYFTYESHDTLKSFTLFISIKAITKPNQGHFDKSEIKISKNSRRRGSRSPDNTELDHFTFLFCSGRQGNVPRIKTHVQSYCPAAVAVVVFLSSLLFSSLKLSFSDVVVAVVDFSNSLIVSLWNSSRVQT